MKTKVIFGRKRKNVKDKQINVTKNEIQKEENQQQNNVEKATEITETKDSNESLLNQIMTPPDAPINEIQKHFQELYEKKETTNYSTQAHRKELINKFLKEINSNSQA